MSTIMTGNILDITEGAILHQVNCMGKMGAGVAGVLARKYPKVKEEYLDLCETTKRDDLLGKLQSVKVDDNLYVINSFTQKYYGRNVSTKYTDEELLIENIRKTVKASKQKGMNVYIPYKVGCGLGNGDWDTILKGIEDLDVMIVKLPE